MLHFCTLFDSNYLARGIALYNSIQRCCPDFHLYVFAFDELSLEVLSTLNKPRLTVISLAEFEDVDLLSVKSTRSKAEYCWTATPATILYVLQKFQVPHCTYLDADLYFYSNPKVLIDEMPSETSVLITDHRYTPAYDKSALSGRYCVQFMFFRNDKKGLTALKWWKDACITWCFARFEDGKFGDQKYLDDWPTRFEGVHELKHQGGGLAPWNVQQYRFQQTGTTFSGIVNHSQEHFEVVFFHFHGVKLFSGEKTILAPKAYKLSKVVKKLFYMPYINELNIINTELKKTWPLHDFNSTKTAKAYWQEKILAGNFEYIKRNILR